MGARIDLNTGTITGDGVSISTRTIGDLAGVFRDEAARAAMDQAVVVYRVESYEPAPEGSEGAVCCATTFLMPGLVGDECFLTRGHFHINQDRPELEMTVSGSGLLVMMDESGHTWTENMVSGSLHHTPPRTAHRVANTGQQPLVFVSYWPSETGHDYATIRDRGFGGRVRMVDGRPVLVPETRG